VVVGGAVVVVVGGAVVVVGVVPPPSLPHAPARTIRLNAIAVIRRSRPFILDPLLGFVFPR